MATTYTGVINALKGQQSAGMPDALLKREALYLQWAEDGTMLMPEWRPLNIQRNGHTYVVFAARTPLRFGQTALSPVTKGLMLPVGGRVADILCQKLDWAAPTTLIVDQIWQQSGKPSPHTKLPDGSVDEIVWHSETLDADPKNVGLFQVGKKDLVWTNKLLTQTTPHHPHYGLHNGETAIQTCNTPDKACSFHPYPYADYSESFRPIKRTAIKDGIPTDIHTLYASGELSYEPLKNFRAYTGGPVQTPPPNPPSVTAPTTPPQGSSPPPQGAPPATAPNWPKGQTVSIARYPGADKLPLQFWQRLAGLCLELDINPSGAACIMYHESGFNPQALNKHDGGSGLLQFTGSSVKKALGWSPEEIRAMTGLEQLEGPMAKFWAPARGKLKTAGDFYVWNMGRDPSSPDSTILAPASRPWGGLPALHKALDHDKDGDVTLADIKAEAKKTEGASFGKSPIVVEPVFSSGTAGPGENSDPKPSGLVPCS